MSSSSGPFDNFNAKYSTQEQVAETFVSNDDFFSIAKNNHTFVLGPRGCGKTTMFKMLTTPALDNWTPKTIRDSELKNNFPFIAIYIPSDELWKDQLKSLLDSFPLEKKLVGIISSALINTNILTNFCRSIKNHIDFLNTEDKRDKEFKFSEELINVWSLSNCTSSLPSIKINLEKRRAYLMEKIKKFVILNGDDLKQIELEEYFFADFVDSVKLGISAFENIYNDGAELKWALCFDELELVSADFFEDITKKLRIAPPNIVFKLSSGPLTDFKNNIAQVFHDYEIVKMWPFSYTEEGRYSKFCEQIAIERIEKFREFKKIKKYIDIDFTKVFGTLDYTLWALKEFNFAINLNAEENEPNSLTWHIFKESAKYDNDLRLELEKRGINSENPVPRTQKNYDTFIRKTKEIVINRLVYSKMFNNKAMKRSRKEYPIYYGRETIFRICEGNPRFIMNIINELIIESNKYQEIANLTFSPEEQAIVLKNVSVRFKAMLNTYPTSVNIGQRSVDLEWLIDKIGNYFDNEINRGHFKSNPVNSFFYEADETIEEIQKLINVGVELGAFIKIDKSEDDLINHKGTRFRLSYLLHPTFKLPLRLYSSRNLRQILSSDRDWINQKLDLN